jgi:hypothetical protein
VILNATERGLEHTSTNNIAKRTKKILLLAHFDDPLGSNIINQIIVGVFYNAVY